MKIFISLLVKIFFWQLVVGFSLTIAIVMPIKLIPFAEAHHWSSEQEVAFLVFWTAFWFSAAIAAVLTWANGSDWKD